MSTSQRAVLITGASSGIGKACALHLAERGFLVFAGVRTEKDADALKHAAPDRLRPIILDVTCETMIGEAVNTVSSQTDAPLFGLVNNAGIGWSGVLEATPVDELRKVMEVNVMGLHAVTRAFLPMLRENRGRIVNVGSAISFMAGPGSSAYAASKFAVRAMTDALRLELQPLGMHVSLIAPGAVESEIWKKGKANKQALRQSTSPEVRQAYALFVRASDKIARHIKPAPAVAVARAVDHALTARKPRLVYLVGKDARKVRLLMHLPQALTNTLILKHITRIANSEDR